MVQTRTAVFQQVAKQARVEIDAALARTLKFPAGCPDLLRQAMEHCLLAPGKRLRPLLVLLSADACGCSHKQAMPAACAVELIHTYSLIHDDLPAMDDDALRRGRPTCHIAFDEATAILAGDAFQARAFELLATEITPPAVAARCCAELAQTAGATALVGGQMDDIHVEESSMDLLCADTIDRLESIHARKTGELFRTSLRLGALVAQADNELLEHLDTYGTKLGLAFQIVDDLLDTQGDVHTVGKAVGKDVEQGKITFPKVLGVEDSQQRARQLIDEACLALTPFNSRADNLEALAHYVLERNH